MDQCTDGARGRGNGAVSFEKTLGEIAGPVCTDPDQAVCHTREITMTDESQTSQTDPGGRKRGGRKAGSAAPGGNGAAGVLDQDQSLTGEEALQGSAQTTAPVPFAFQGKAVRTITKNGEIWFVAADVCAALDITNSRDALSRLDDDEKGVGITDTPGGPQQVNIVGESGLYTLISTSQKPEAKAFRRWVTGVVLPTLRRTGQFDMRGQADQIRPVRDEIDSSSRNTITVPLPGPGRYLVVLLHDGERRVEPISFSDAISALAPLDCRTIAYTHLTAAALWEKLQHVRSVTGDACGGFTFEKLSATMQAGADLARQILYTYDEPMLVPRKTADVTDG